MQFDLVWKEWIWRKLHSSKLWPSPILWPDPTSILNIPFVIIMIIPVNDPLTRTDLTLILIILILCDHPHGSPSCPPPETPWTSPTLGHPHRVARCLVAAWQEFSPVAWDHLPPLPPPIQKFKSNLYFLLTSQHHLHMIMHYALETDTVLWRQNFTHITPDDDDDGYGTWCWRRGTWEWFPPRDRWLWGTICPLSLLPHPPCTWEQWGPVLLFPTSDASLASSSALSSCSLNAGLSIILYFVCCCQSFCVFWS